MRHATFEWLLKFFCFLAAITFIATTITILPIDPVLFIMVGACIATVVRVMMKISTDNLTQSLAEKLSNTMMVFVIGILFAVCFSARIDMLK